MSWQVTVTPDGIILRSLFRNREFKWEEIAGFYLREEGLRAGDSGYLLAFRRGGNFRIGIGGDTSSSPATVRVKLTDGSDYQLRGIHSEEQIHELNRLMDEGRRS